MSLEAKKLVSSKGIRGKQAGIVGLPWFSPASHCGYSGNKNWQLHYNFRIVPGILLIQCIQERQKPSWRRCDVACLQGYFTYAHHGIEKQLGVSLVRANKTSHYVASWCRQPGGTSEDFQLFRDQFDHIRNQHKGKKKLPSVHVLKDFNFRDIDWPDRLNKSCSALSQSEGQMLIDIMNDRGLEQLVHFLTREKKILWIYYSLLCLV